MYVIRTYVCPTALKCNTSGLQLNVKPNGFVHPMNTKLDYKGTIGTHTHLVTEMQLIKHSQVHEEELIEFKLWAFPNMKSITVRCTTIII